MDDGKSITAFSSTLMPEPSADGTSPGNSTWEDSEWDEESWGNTTNGTSPASDYIPDWYQYYDCQAPYSTDDHDFIEEINAFYNHMVKKYDLTDAMMESLTRMETERWQNGLKGAGHAS
jgi:hypothetical protein